MLCGISPSSRGRVFNLSDHRTKESFVEVIAIELGCPTPTLRLPERPVRWLSQVCASIPSFPLTPSRINAMTNRSVYSIQKIQNELGYVHRITMEEGICQLVRAWKQSK
jgi:nucleoside-diphosphate-sugar epimerase